MSSSSKTPEETRIIVVLSTMIYQKHCVMLALFTRPTFCHFQLLLKALKEGAIWYLRKGKNAVLFCEMLFMSEVHLCLFKSGTYVVQFRYGALFFVECRWPQAVLMAYISSNARLQPKTLLRLIPLPWQSCQQKIQNEMLYLLFFCYVTGKGNSCFNQG